MTNAVEWGAVIKQL